MPTVGAMISDIIRGIISILNSIIWWIIKVGGIFCIVSVIIDIFQSRE